jgi:hypothetical protein
VRQTFAAALVMLTVAGFSAEGLAWGAIGHEWISGITIEKLPGSVPEFIGTPEAAAEIAAMARERDRARGADKTHDAELDPGTWMRSVV